MRAGALGDVLLLRPALHALRAAGFEPVLMAPRASGSVLVGDGEAAELIDWERGDVAALLDAEAPLAAPLGEELRAMSAALACSRNETLAARLGALISRVAVVDPAPPAGVHAAAWYCSALTGLGIAPPAEPPPPLALPAAERRAAAAWRGRLGTRFVAVHPGSGSAAKNWPVRRYERLVRALAGSSPWLLVEGPADRASAESLGTPGAVRARDLPPRTLAALLAEAALFVGNDSGVTHLAAACGTPTLALFGPTDPAQWRPLGPRVTVLRAPGGSMGTLEVDAVLEAAQRLLEAAGSPT